MTRRITPHSVRSPKKSASPAKWLSFDTATMPSMTLKIPRIRKRVAAKATHPAPGASGARLASMLGTLVGADVQVGDHSKGPVPGQGAPQDVPHPRAQRRAELRQGSGRGLAGA